MFVEKRLESRPDGLAEGVACSILLKQPWILFFVGGQQLVNPSANLSALLAGYGSFKQCMSPNVWLSTRVAALALLPSAIFS